MGTYSSATPPAMLRGCDGNLQVIGLKPNDGKAFLIWQYSGNGSWHSYGLLPRLWEPLTTLVMDIDIDKTLQAVGLDNDGIPHLIWQSGEDSSWHADEQLPGPTPPIPFGSLAVAIGYNARLEVVCVGRDDGQPYLLWRDGVAGSWHWHGRLPHTGPPLGAIAMAVGGDGNLQVIGLGRTDGMPYLIWQDTQNGGWDAYGLLPNAGKPLAALAMARGGDGNLQVIGIGRDDGQPYLIWQYHRTGSWYSYGLLPHTGVPLRSTAVGMGNSRNLQVVCLGKYDDQPYLIWQSGSDSSWHGYGLLPNPGVPFEALGIGEGNNRCLQVVGLARSTWLPYLIWQNYADGSWYSYGLLPDSESYCVATAADPTPPSVHLEVNIPGRSTTFITPASSPGDIYLNYGTPVEVIVVGEDTTGGIQKLEFFGSTTTWYEDSNGIGSMRQGLSAPVQDVSPAQPGQLTLKHREMRIELKEVREANEVGCRVDLAGAATNYYGSTTRTRDLRIHWSRP